LVEKGTLKEWKRGGYCDKRWEEKWKMEYGEKRGIGGGGRWDKHVQMDDSGAAG